MSEREINDDRTVDRDHDTNPDESGKWLSAIIALLGAWMLVEAVWFDVVATQFWNDVLVGALLLAVGGYNYYRRTNEEAGSVAAAGIAAVLGLWLVAAPFVFGTDAGVAETTNALAFWNDFVVGLVVFLLGIYSAYRARSERPTPRRTAG